MRISGITYAVHKTNRPRYIAAVIAGLIFLALTALLMISAYSGWKLLHPVRMETEAFSSNIVPEYSDASFSTADKSVKLYGWYFKAKSSNKTVIFVHSYGGNRMLFGNDTINLVKELLEKGYNVLTFDLRASGKSTGKMSTFGFQEKDDVSAAIKWAKAQGSPHIALLGFSTGASAAIMAAAENEAVQAVIADSPYSNLEDYLEKNLNRWTSLPPFPFNKTVLLSLELFSGTDADKASPIRVLQESANFKLLLIHSKNNKLIGIENSKKLLHIAGSTTTLWETASSGDSAYSEMPKEYTDKIITFLSSVLDEEN